MRTAEPLSSTVSRRRVRVAIDQAALGLRQRERPGQEKPADIQPVAARVGDILGARRDRPGAWSPQAAGRVMQHPHDVGLEHEDVDREAQRPR